MRLPDSSVQKAETLGKWHTWQKGQGMSTIVPLLLCLTGSSVSFPVEGSGTHWTIIGVHEYFIYNGSYLETYNGAAKRCEELKSHLVILDSDETQRIVVDLISSTIPQETVPPYTSFYIGLRDYTGHNTNFIWDNGDILHFIDGTPMQWSNGEPNDFNNMAEDCVTMGSKGEKDNYNWFDVPCDTRASYICQRYTADAIIVVTPESYILSTAVVIIIMFLIVSTAIYHRRKILHVHLVAEPPLAPYTNSARDKDAPEWNKNVINTRDPRKNVWSIRRAEQFVRHESGSDSP